MSSYNSFLIITTTLLYIFKVYKPAGSFLMVSFFIFLVLTIWGTVRRFNTAGKVVAGDYMTSSDDASLYM